MNSELFPIGRTDKSWPRNFEPISGVRRGVTSEYRFNFTVDAHIPQIVLTYEIESNPAQGIEIT